MLRDELLHLLRVHLRERHPLHRRRLLRLHDLLLAQLLLLRERLGLG